MKKYIISFCAAALISLPAMAADAPQCPMSKGGCCAAKTAAACPAKKDAKAGACCAKKAAAAKQQAGAKGATDLVKR